MKNTLCLFILVMLLVTAGGCTAQQAKPAVTETIATVASPEVTTVPGTPVPTTILTTVPATTAAPEADANVTTPATPGPEMTPSTAVTTIHIRNNTFVPDQLTVLPGTGIIWINDDPGTHLVKATGDAAGKFTSAELITGARFGYTFGETTGTYEFMDPNYPDMKGAIVVMHGATLWVATFAPATPA